MPEYRVLHGDCRAVMRSFGPESADAIVTDPPYELDFMSKGWDNRGVAFDERTWKMALRIAKPGAHLLAFGGTRTFHRLTVAIEDAGWEIRDCLMWLHGQGFPKSDSLLKPAWEPIVLARKAGPLLPLNIDACRIPSLPGDDGTVRARRSPMGYHGSAGAFHNAPGEQGRWPANLILDEESAALLDEQTAGTRASKPSATGGRFKPTGLFPIDNPKPVSYADSGGASRFFYVAKASPSEREAGLGGMPQRTASVGNMEAAGRNGSNPANYVGHKRQRVEMGLSATKPRANHHPTVKPIALMRYLCRLITPPGGLIVDPFCGSGTTGCAAVMEGFAFIGIEESEEYVEIANRRVAHWAKNERDDAVLG